MRISSSCGYPFTSTNKINLTCTTASDVKIGLLTATRKAGLDQALYSEAVPKSALPPVSTNTLAAVPRATVAELCTDAGVVGRSRAGVTAGLFPLRDARNL